MIILNSQKSKKNFQEIIDEYNRYINQLNYSLFECPHCNSTIFIRWGGYDRTIYYIYKGEILFDTMHIQRVKCKECNHTHALIPSYMIPYKQYGLEVILSCIDDRRITYQYHFSMDTILKWKKQFSCFYPRLKTMIPNRNNLFDIILNHLYNIYKEFYDRNKMILMMTHQGILNMAYF